MIIIEKMEKKNSPIISYYREKLPAKFTASGKENNYCVPKCKRSECKVKHFIKSNTGIVFSAFLKVLAGEICDCRAFQDTAEKKEQINVIFIHNTLACVFHLVRARLEYPLEKTKNV